MPTVGHVEKKIEEVEGFRVRFVRPADSSRRKDVRSDKRDMPQYDEYVNAAADKWTVATWIAKRFKPRYPGYDVEVLDASNQPVPGNTRLATVRDSYKT